MIVANGSAGRRLRRAVVILSALVVASCGRRPTPLVVLYVVDTLRADHTSVYGYARDTTPELAKLAADSVVFDPTISAASWTKPAVGSILTSQLPGRHGAVQLRDVLSPDLPTIAERLHARGFATGAVIANPVLAATGSGFARGFDTFVALEAEDRRPSTKVGAAAAVDAALRWLDEPRDGPAFLYVHTMDPHIPYAPPPPFDHRYEPAPVPPEHAAADPRFDYREELDRARLVAQYDGEIAYGDQELGRFLRELRARGRYDEALVIVTADHGEEFLEHGQWSHGHGVFDEVVRVPLVVKFPRRRGAGRVLKRQVQTVDILPTVLRECGLSVPEPPEIAGRPLQAVVGGGAGAPVAVSAISHHGFVAVGVRTAGDKYIRRFGPSDDELYFDLAADPQETKDRLQAATARVHVLRPHVDDAIGVGPYRRRLRFAGDSSYALELRTSGRIEAMDAAGFGAGDRVSREASGRLVTVQVRPRPGAPLELVFDVRPSGAAVWVTGTRDGRRLVPADVHIAREDLAPAGVPFKIPDLEPADSTSRSARGRAARPADRGPFVDETTADLLSPPAGAGDGLWIWLDTRPGAALQELDAETRARLAALGYLGR